MFESIVLKSSTQGQLFDLGALAEAMIFYRRVHIVGNSLTLRFLLERVTPRLFLSLLRDQRLVFHYLEDQVGVSTSGGRQPAHRLVRFSSPDHTAEKAASVEFKRCAPGATRIEVSRLASSIKSLSHDGFSQAELLKSIAHGERASFAVASIIGKVVPAYVQVDAIKFHIDDRGDEFVVQSNVDFDDLNRKYHQRIPQEHSSLSEAFLLALIQGAYSATYYAACLSSELVTDEVDQAIQANHIEDSLQRLSQGPAQIARFSEVVLQDSRAIRDAVNSNKLKFADVVTLLDKAEKFREWLHTAPPDRELLQAYCNEIVRKNPIVDRLPHKVTRWSLFTAAGLAADLALAGGVGTASGVLVSALDAFVVERLLQGWRPHQFVEESLKPRLSR